MKTKGKYYAELTDYGFEGAWVIYKERRWWFDKPTARFSIYGRGPEKSSQLCAKLLEKLNET